MYARSIERNFPGSADGTRAEVRDISSKGFSTLAREILASATAAHLEPTEQQ